jgi:hypothetical protein
MRIERSRVVWKFRVEVEEVDDGHGRYATRATTASGRVLERFGSNPLWDLLRILGANAIRPVAVDGESDSTGGNAAGGE